MRDGRTKTSLKNAAQLFGGLLLILAAASAALWKIGWME